MSYRFKAQTVVIDGVESIIIPTTLPLNPSNGHYAIDSTDGKLKVWNASKNRWIVLGDAEDVIFDNSTNGFTASNTQTAIEEANLIKSSVQFQTIGTMDWTQYMYSYVHTGSGNNLRRSGDPSNGYRYGNSAPIVSAVNGKIIEATAVIRGIGQSTGSPAANLELKFELWKVGMNGNEGTKLSDIVFNVDTSTYSVGNWWNTGSLTLYNESINLDVNVNKGDLLGLKFIRQTGNNKVVAVENTTVTFLIKED